MRLLPFLVLTLFLAAACGPQDLPSIQTSQQSSTFESQDVVEVDKDCSSAYIKSIQVPNDHFSPGSSLSVTYRYEKIEALGATTTIVYLPGGPGDHSIAKGELSESIEAFNRIFIDPRSVGCNYQGKGSFKGKLNTRQHAMDVFSVIKAEQLNDYIIYGVSYGTVVATILTELIEQSSFQPPKAVVLEGILGSAFRGSNQQTFNLVWNQIVDSNPVVSEFMSGPHLKHNPSEDWEIFIKTALYYDKILVENVITAYAHKNFGPELYDWAKGVFEVVIEDSTEVRGENNMFQQVGCSEIFHQEKSFPIRWQDARWVDDLHQVEASPCLENGISTNNPFDSRQHQIRAPLYYIQGSADPATPASTARYHFNNQHSSQMKTWLLVDEGGHVPTATETQLKECASQLWHRIDQVESFSGLVGANGRCLFSSEESIALPFDHQPAEHGPSNHVNSILPILTADSTWH